MTTSAVYLSYPDPGPVIAWLEAIGFRVTLRQAGDDGMLVHGELVRGDVAVMLGADDAGYRIPPLVGRSTGVGVYLVTDTVDALFARAVEAGGRAVIPPEDTGWGARRARVLDPGGREWSFGSHEPGRER